MDTLNEQKLTRLFNRTFNAMIGKIRKEVGNRTKEEKTLHSSLELIEDAMKIDYKIIIFHFSKYIYKEHKDKILKRDETFLSEKTFRKYVDDENIMSYILPIIKIYKNSDKKQKDIIYDYMVKFVKICVHYEKFLHI